MSKYKKFKEFFFKKETSLKIKSLRAGIWTILGKGSNDLLRLISSLILTRILYPEAFGLMATGLVIITMVQLFSDTGVKVSLIQNPKGDNPNYLNSAWIISIIRSTFLFIFVLSLSIPIANFYNQPELKYILGIMSVGILINGFENPALAIIIKKLRAEKQVIYELGTQILGFITTLILAYLLRSVIALAIGYLLLSVYRVIGSYIVESYRPRLIWNKEAGSALFHFGKYIFLNTLITWTTMNADRLIIGKALNMEALGIYSIGLNIGIIIEMLFVQILNQSYFPALSSVSTDLNRAQRMFRRTSTLVVGLSIPILTVISLFSKEIISILYDPRYAMASIALTWISLRGIFRIISIIQGQTLIALGKPSMETISMFIGMVLLAIIMPYGAHNYGLEGVAIAAFVVGIIITIAQSMFLLINLNYSYKVIIRPWLQAFFTSVAIFFVYSLLKPHLSYEGIHNIPLLITVSIMGLIISASYYFYLEGTNPFKDLGGETKKEAWS